MTLRYFTEQQEKGHNLADRGKDFNGNSKVHYARDVFLGIETDVGTGKKRFFCNNDQMNKRVGPIIIYA